MKTLIFVAVLLGSVASARAQCVNCAVNDNGSFSVPVRAPVISPAAAATQTAIAAPTAPASTSAYAMQGLAGTVTPAVTGTVLITVSGTIVSPSGTTAGLGIEYQVSYGTGAAPANAAALAGTQVGTVQSYTNAATVTAADVAIPFSAQVVVTGLAVGTAYWIDLAAESLGTVSEMGLSNVSVSVIETR
jgi:hypothetical protein